MKTSAASFRRAARGGPARNRPVRSLGRAEDKKRWSPGDEVARETSSSRAWRKAAQVRRGGRHLHPGAGGNELETDIDNADSRRSRTSSTQKVDIICSPGDSVGLVAPVKKAIGRDHRGQLRRELDDKALPRPASIWTGLVPPTTKEGPTWRTGAGQEAGQGRKSSSSRATRPTTPRCEGRLRQAAKDAGLKVLASRTAHWETEEANTLVTNLLTQHPDVQGIMRPMTRWRWVWSRPSTPRGARQGAGGRVATSRPCRSW